MGNLGDSAGRVFTCLVVTHANILASVRSTAPHSTASQLYGTLLYYDLMPEGIRTFTASVYRLAPLNIRRIDASTSELLRFL